MARPIEPLLPWSRSPGCHSQGQALFGKANNGIIANPIRRKYNDFISVIDQGKTWRWRSTALRHWRLHMLGLIRHLIFFVVLGSDGLLQVLIAGNRRVCKNFPSSMASWGLTYVLRGFKISSPVLRLMMTSMPFVFVFPAFGSHGQCCWFFDGFNAWKVCS